MEKSAMFDKALEMLIGDMDDMEGKSAMSHSMEDCPDPMHCDMHDDEVGESLPHEEPKQEEGSPAAVTVEVHKMGMPSMDGEKDKDLKPEEVEALKKLLK